MDFQLFENTHLKPSQRARPPGCLRCPLRKTLEKEAPQIRISGNVPLQFLEKDNVSKEAINFDNTKHLLDGA